MMKFIYIFQVAQYYEAACAPFIFMLSIIINLAYKKDFVKILQYEENVQDWLDKYGIPVRCNSRIV